MKCLSDRIVSLVGLYQDSSVEVPQLHCLVHGGRYQVLVYLVCAQASDFSRVKGLSKSALCVKGKYGPLLATLHVELGDGSAGESQHAKVATLRHLD